MGHALLSESLFDLCLGERTHLYQDFASALARKLVLDNLLFWHLRRQRNLTDRSCDAIAHDIERSFQASPEFIRGSGLL